jgi:pimeloyl-ACP methyl ester carboxylesterase/membrane protein DedA with SNARE-associated domain
VSVRRWVLLIWLLLLLTSHVTRALSGEPALPPQMASRELSGARVAFREWPGAPGAPAVLLVHGSPGSSRDFAAVADALPEGWRKLSVDLPGFGASSHALPDYSSRAHARYLLALLDELGLEQVHLVGHSLGGAVILEMAAQQPQRVRSLVMISAVGVQELELLGDYELNHALHGLQLAALTAADWALPHFGLLDRFPLGLPYARNFYDTDQRPLRAVLEGLQPPLRVLHGRHDLQVPVQAALEHHRIVPHSELHVWEDQSHFAIFVRPGEVARDIADFVGRVEDGRARTRAEATPEELARAQVPYDPAALGPVRGMGAWLLGALLALSTLVSEDLASVTAGLLVGHGRLPWLTAAGSIFVGIFGGDVLCVLFGRLLGRRTLQRWPLSSWVEPAAVDRAARWLERHGGAAVFTSRFLPGTRFAVYVAAGVLEVPLLGFSAWLCVAAALWAALVVSATALLGQAAQDLLDQGGLWAGFGLALVLVLLLRLTVQLSTWRGRRLLLGAWRRWTQWEFWPMWLFYPPVLLYGLALAWRHRPITVFTAANPGIPGGGVVGESKWDIYRRLGLHDPARAGHPFLPPTARLEPERRLVQAEAFVAEHGLPVVLKPDVGQRGDGVAVIRSREELHAHLASARGDVLAQGYVPGHEVGLFYVRRPDQARGELFSVTHKLPLDVIGDGEHTLEWLILADERAVCMAGRHLDRWVRELDRVPARGERVRIQELGTHSRGSIFQDGAELATPALGEALDRITGDFEGGFFFGRFDVRCASYDELKAGRFRILELNGVTSEATHIYGGALLPAWQTLMRQWALAYTIGAANHAQGTPVTSLGELVRAWWRYKGQAPS